MTEAKKKAQELVAIFGKELAVKCVDEVLNDDWTYSLNEEEPNRVKFWLEVKQEILNL